MKLTKLIPPILNLFVFSLFSFNLFAAPGDLDTTFGKGGKVTTPVLLGGGALNVKLQTDGKIVVLGAAFNSNFGNDIVFAINCGIQGSQLGTFNRHSDSECLYSLKQF